MRLALAYSLLFWALMVTMLLLGGVWLLAALALVSVMLVATIVLLASGWRSSSAARERGELDSWRAWYASVSEPTE